MKEICIFVGSIEEWNFLYSKIIKLQENSSIDFKLVVTGKLLSPDFDLKYKEIEKKFKIYKKIEMYPKLDTSLSNSNSLSLAIMGFANIFEDLKPDYIVVCGNSYSIFGACITSSIYKIPILNIFSKLLIDVKIPNYILETIVNISEINFIEDNDEKEYLISEYDKKINVSSLKTFCNLYEKGMKNILIFNKIPLEKIEIGMSVSYSQTITDTDIKAFAGISGDKNPVHLDEVYAKKSIFKNKIAHGMMTASYFSALFGTKIPGEGCVYTYQSLNFKKPIYINDTVEAIVTVTNVDINKRKVKFNTVCKVDNKIVTDGEAELYVPVEFNKIMITDKNELLKYKLQILDLFEHSFGSKMDEKLWNWAYIDNPNGNPIVSLYFDGEKLVGHYAVIPIKFIYSQKNLNAVLSMTTMVDTSYRKYGIFVEQANEVYEKSEELGYKFVCGFPNKKSAPGFKKRLDWILEEDLYVANFSYDELQKIDKKTYSNSISFNTQDKENLEWRLNKPNQNYFKKDENILKEFNDNFDIVYNSSDFSNLEKGKKYNLLLDHDLDKYLDKKEFDYIFGYKLFDTSLKGIEFKKDLIMSDVF